MRVPSLLIVILLSSCWTPLKKNAPKADEAPVSHEEEQETGASGKAQNGAIPSGMGEAPSVKEDVPTATETSSILRLELTPGGRKLLATGEAVPLRVIAYLKAGGEKDVSEQALFSVRNENAGAIEGSVFTAGARGSLSTVISASFDGATSNPLLVSIVKPLFAEPHDKSIALSGTAGQTFTLSTSFAEGLNLSKMERVRLNFRSRGSARLRIEPGYRAPDGSFVSLNVSRTLEPESSGIADFEVDGAWLAHSNNARAFVVKGSLESDGEADLTISKSALIDQFLVGVNVPWLDGAYQHDFGRSFHHKEWDVAYDPSHVEALLGLLQTANIRLMRVWVFEACEGFQKDESEIVNGIEPTLLANFDDFVFKRLPKYDIKVVFMLLGARHTVSCTSPSPIGNAAARKGYFDNAMVPFVTRYQASPWVYGFDLMNEAEGAVQGNDGNWENSGGVSWDTMRDFLGEASRAARAAAPASKISASSGWHNELNVKAGRFSGLGFNYLDFHNYTDDGSLASYATLNRAAKVVLGEAGQKSSMRDEGLQSRVLKTMLKAAYDGNYWGIWPWALEYPGANSAYALLSLNATYSSLRTTPAYDALADFVRTHEDIGP